MQFSIKKYLYRSEKINVQVFEKKYSRLYKGKNGRVAKPLRLALGSLIIPTQYQYSDRELVDQLTENPYYQYFVGLPGYQEEPPIDASTLVLFRKRLKMDVIMEAHGYSNNLRQKSYLHFGHKKYYGRNQNIVVRSLSK